MSTSEEICCPNYQCQSNEKINHGKQNGVQKFKCKKCGRYFLEKIRRKHYSRTEKKYLSMLIKFLKGSIDKKRIEIKDVLEDIDEVLPELEKVQLIQKQIGEEDKIYCYNPRLLICENEHDIILYRFAPRKNRPVNRVIVFDTTEKRCKSHSDHHLPSFP